MPTARDSVSITFAKPVDGVGGLSLTVNLYSPKKTGDPVDILLQSIDTSRSCRFRPATP